MLPFINVNGKFTVFANNVQFNFDNTHANYDKIIANLRELTDNEFVALVDIKKNVREASNNTIVFQQGDVYYRGAKIEHQVVERIRGHWQDSLPFEPLLKFLENLLQNPSMAARKESYRFIEHKNLPITEDGCFLGYKAVDCNMKDKFSHSILNEIGVPVKIERSECDDDVRLDCSYGLHVGSLEYVRSFANSDDIVLVVKVNPKDIICVPVVETTKLRCCEYLPMFVYDEPLPDLYQSTTLDDMDIPKTEEEQDDYFDDDDDSELDEDFESEDEYEDEYADDI